MRSVTELLNSNEQFANGYRQASHTDTDLLIITCMDRRIDPLKIFDLQDGEAYVIRTAGGRTGDAIRSISVAIAAGVRRVIVMHHTDCKMANDPVELKRLLDESLHESYEGEIHAITHPNQALREDVDRIRGLREGLEVVGTILDVDTGSVSLRVS